MARHDPRGAGELHRRRLLGGWLCDRLGRRRIYQSDLLVYAFGLLWIIFAQAPWMLVFGDVLPGLAVGADVPASWTPIAETAPARARGKLGGVAQVLWMMGPVVVLLLALFPLGLVVAIGNVLLLGVGGGFSQQPFFQLWSGEMSPRTCAARRRG